MASPPTQEKHREGGFAGCDASPALHEPRGQLTSGFPRQAHVSGAGRVARASGVGPGVVHTGPGSRGLREQRVFMVVVYIYIYTHVCLLITVV